MKAVYCRDCKHMKVENWRREYSLDYYGTKFVIKMPDYALPLLITGLIISGGTLFIAFVILTYVYNLCKKHTEQMCLFSGQDDLVNGGKIEGTALTCKLYKDSAGCNHFVEKLTLEQEIEETLKKLNEIKGI